MKELVIVACGPGWHNAPDVSGDHDTWGVNDLVCERPVDVAFQLHNREQYVDVSEVDGFDRTMGAIRRDGIPAYMLETRLEYPETVIRYPIEQIIQRFGEPYFSCSIAYMLALAILKKYEKIDIYGCTVFQHEEYAYQKPCIEYWTGMARGSGVEVNFHQPTSICQTDDLKLYGYGMTYPQLKHVVLKY